MASWRGGKFDYGKRPRPVYDYPPFVPRTPPHEADGPVPYVPPGGVVVAPPALPGIPDPVLSAPVLIWTSPQTDATPEFTVDVTTPAVGDVITLQLASDSGFTTAVQTFTDTMDSTEVANLAPTLGITSQANGTYYARAKQTRSGTDSAWSNTVTVTINVAAVTKSYSYKGSSFSNDVSATTTHTFDLGTAATGRVIVVQVYDQNDLTTGVTVNGVTMTLGVTGFRERFYYGVVPTGTTGVSVVHTMSGGAFTDRVISVWSLYGVSSSPLGSYGGSFNPPSTVSTGIAVAAGDFFFAGALDMAFDTGSEAPDALHTYAPGGFTQNTADWTIDATHANFVLGTSGLTGTRYAVAIAFR